MAAIALLSVLCFSGSALIVGFRLLALALRTRALPELLLGAAFVITVVGNALHTGGAYTEYATRPAFSDGTEFGVFVLNLGFAFWAMFNYRVYHPTSRAVAGVAWVLGVALVGSEFFHWGVLDETTRTSDAWYWLRYSLRAAVLLWSAFEAFRYRRLLSRRARYGLADPVVTNRFLLWGVASAVALFMLTCFELAEFVGFMSPAGETFTILGSLPGPVAAALFWFAFFPPARYRRWLLTRGESRVTR